VNDFVSTYLILLAAVGLAIIQPPTEMSTRSRKRNISGEYRAAGT
jgi:hypothetical protein